MRSISPAPYRCPSAHSNTCDKTTIYKGFTKIKQLSLDQRSGQSCILILCCYFCTFHHGLVKVAGVFFFLVVLCMCLCYKCRMNSCFYGFELIKIQINRNSKNKSPSTLRLFFSISFARFVIIVIIWLSIILSGNHVSHAFRQLSFIAIQKIICINTTAAIIKL